MDIIPPVAVTSKQRLQIHCEMRYLISVTGSNREQSAIRGSILRVSEKKCSGVHRLTCSASTATSPWLKLRLHHSKAPSLVAFFSRSLGWAFGPPRPSDTSHQRLHERAIKKRQHSCLWIFPTGSSSESLHHALRDTIDAACCYFSAGFPSHRTWLQ